MRPGRISCGAPNGASHLARTIDEESGAAVLDDFGQRAGRERDHGSAAGERLHCHQRAGLGDQAGDQQAAGGGEEAAFAREADRSDEAARAAIERGAGFPLQKYSSCAR